MRRFIDKIRNEVAHWFNFTKTEANAFLILAPIVVLMTLFIPYFKFYRFSKESIPMPERITLDSTGSKIAKRADSTYDTDHPDDKILSGFDPNTANFTQLVRHGLDTIIAARLISYRNHGGKFKFKEDLRQIYELDSQTLQSVYDHIRLPPRPKPEPEKRSKPKISLPEEITSIEINSADTIALQSIRGIGPVLARRITKYRDLLGGFVDTVQFKEVYGLRDYAIKNLKDKARIDKQNIKRIKINTAEYNELARHPYCSKQMARLIISYRNQHGEYSTIDDLNKIKVIDEIVYKRLAPYLTIDSEADSY